MKGFGLFETGLFGSFKEQETAEVVRNHIGSRKFYQCQDKQRKCMGIYT
jgi:hypothetical protein